jgi:adenosine deaminase
MPPSGPIAAIVPKVHLHCHLEGTLRAATFVELADAHGVPLRYRPSTEATTAWPDESPPEVDRSNPYQFRDFGEFLLTFAAASRALQQPADYARLAREFVEDALAGNVMYGELFVSPSVWTFFNPELDVRAAFDAIATELRAAEPRAHFALIVDLTRNFGAARAMTIAQLATTLTSDGVVGIGLGGDEARFPPELFVDAFAYARNSGLHCVAHAGEAAGPQSVRTAIELLHAERIGHGVRSLEDPSVIELLVRTKTPLEVCPTSNVLTGVALTGGRHAFLELDRAGCVVTIDADDPAMFGTSIERECELVETVAGSHALMRYIENAIGASFASPERKQAMRLRLAAELQGVRRSENDNVGA